MTIGINLIPFRIQSKRAMRRRLKAWIIPVAVSAGMVTTPIVLETYRRGETEKLQTHVDHLRTSLALDQTKLGALTAELGVVQGRVERANALRSKRAWSDVFALIGRCLPEGSWLTSVSTDPVAPTGSVAPKAKHDKTAPITAVALEAPRRLKIVGFAKDPSEPYQFVTAVKQSNAFTSVKLTHSRREPVLDGMYFNFELLCEW